MSLEKLRLVNFQVHETLDLEFDPHITTIVGDTDRGKSSIIRSFGWIFYNHAATSFLRHDTDVLYSRLLLDETRIIRQRGESNTYRVGSDSPLKAVGHGAVPETVEQLLNVREWTIQWQGDPPFWFHLTPGQVSKELNQIVNLSVIDSSLAYVAKELRRAKTVVEVTEERYNKAESKRKSYLWVTDAVEDWEKLEKKRDKINKLVTARERLWYLLQTLTQTRERKKNLLQVKQQGEKVVALGERLGKHRVRQESLADYIDRLRDLKKRIQPIPDIQPVVVLREDLDRFVERRRNLERYIRQLKFLREKKCLLESQLQESKASEGEVCPTCGQSLPSAESSSRISTSDTKPHSHEQKRGLNGTG